MVGLMLIVFDRCSIEDNWKFQGDRIETRLLLGAWQAPSKNNVWIGSITLSPLITVLEREQSNVRL
jgi:hypothetical protein